jgi:hypothetical protein
MYVKLETRNQKLELNMHIFRSRAGTFTIATDPTVPDCYELCIGGMWLGTYETAEKAAQDVFMRCTGWHDWDRKKEGECPCDLTEWEIVE